MYCQIVEFGTLKFRRVNYYISTNESYAKMKKLVFLSCLFTNDANNLLVLGKTLLLFFTFLWVALGRCNVYVNVRKISTVYIVQLLQADWKDLSHVKTLVIKPRRFS